MNDNCEVIEIDKKPRRKFRLSIEFACKEWIEHTIADLEKIMKENKPRYASSQDLLNGIIKILQGGKKQ